MGAPVAIAVALVKTKTGRRIATGAVIGIVLLVWFALTPLLAIPLAIVGSQVAAQPAAAHDAVPGPAVHGEWGYPMSGGYYKGRGFGYNPVAGCSFCSTNHKGYDMSQGCGSTIYAAGAGTVITAGAFYGWGNTVRIDHGNGLLTLYGHMEWGSLRVTVGQQVSAGSPLGAEGNTGRSFGCHLHYEVQNSGTPVDPEPFMAARGLPLT